MRVIYQPRDAGLGDDSWWTGMRHDRENKGPANWGERHSWFDTLERAKKERQYLLKSGWAKAARVITDEEYDRLCAEGVIRNPMPLPQREVIE